MTGSQKVVGNTNCLGVYKGGFKNGFFHDE